MKRATFLSKVFHLILNVLRKPLLIKFSYNYGYFEIGYDPMNDFVEKDAAFAHKASQ